MQSSHPIRAGPANLAPVDQHRLGSGLGNGHGDCLHSRAKPRRGVQNVQDPSWPEHALIPEADCVYIDWVDQLDSDLDAAHTEPYFFHQPKEESFRPRMCFIRIDPDEPIYRVFPLWFFEDALRRQLFLVPPDMWEDPYEVIVRRLIVEMLRPPYTQNRVSIRAAMYAQSWSSTQESDPLLRAYSRVVKDSLSQRNTCPRDEGVRCGAHHENC